MKQVTVFIRESVRNTQLKLKRKDAKGNADCECAQK